MIKDKKSENLVYKKSLTKKENKSIKYKTKYN